MPASKTHIHPDITRQAWFSAMIKNDTQHEDVKGARRRETTSSKVPPTGVHDPQVLFGNNQQQAPLTHTHSAGSRSPACDLQGRSTASQHRLGPDCLTSTHEEIAGRHSHSADAVTQGIRSCRQTHTHSTVLMARISHTGSHPHTYTPGASLYNNQPQRAYTTEI